jgi:hypothetical protein
MVYAGESEYASSMVEDNTALTGAEGVAVVMTGVSVWTGAIAGAVCAIGGSWLEGTTTTGCFAVGAARDHLPHPERMKTSKSKIVSRVLFIV